MKHEISAPIRVTIAELLVLKNLNIITDFWFPVGSRDLIVKFSKDAYETYEERGEIGNRSYLLIP